MALSPGARLGPYEILAEAGSGGMGEVYRARDTRLDRIVAIKILPEHLSHDAARRQRFEREARAVSSLSHPHICTLHDIGHQDGTDYLVMEYLEGETLAHRLEKGPLALEQMLRYAIEIADALEKAHRQGVVHRDLKPGNVMLTKSGAKLLDFGLAKASLTSGAAELTAATLSRPATAEGTIVGTLQYMAPEQLEGKEVDARSDLFALGAVLYEMATGKKAFEGKSQASVIAAILEHEPPAISSLQPMVPPALDRVVKTCLAKDPDERWQTAHDLKLQLEWIRDAGSQAGVPAPAVAPRKIREPIAWMLAAVLAVLAMLGARGVFQHSSGYQLPVRSFIEAPEKTKFEFTGDIGGSVAISPDGRRLAFVAADGSGKTMIWVRSLDAFEGKPLAGTEGGYYPFWSADGRSLGFFADGKLKRVDAAGGPPQALCDVQNARGGAWSKGDIIVFAPNFQGVGLYQIPASGGVPTPVTQLDTSKHTTHRWPYFLPDGKHFLYLAAAHMSTNRENGEVYVGSLDGRGNKLVLQASANAAYALGYLLFVRQFNLMAQPFDLSRLELTGQAVPIAENVLYDAGWWRSIFAASENGVLAYASGILQGSQLSWFDRAGKQLGVPGVKEDFYYGLRLSPNGQRVLLTAGEPTSNLWILELGRGVQTRFTFQTLNTITGAWSADGKDVMFSSWFGKGADIYHKQSSGAGNEEPLLESNSLKWVLDASPDGRYLLYAQTEMQTATNHLWILPLFGDRKPFLFLNEPLVGWDAQFSPDGRWVAYMSRISGRQEVYVTSFPDHVGKWQISSSGGRFPRWRRDAKEIFYIADNNDLMAVDISVKGPDLVIGTPHFLFKANPYFSATPGYPYDVTADGKRFLICTSRQKNVTPIHLVTNWTADLGK